MELNNSVVNVTAKAKVALTKEELYVQLIFSYSYVGLWSVIAHTSIAVTVFRVERIHSRFFVFIFFLSIARVLYGFNHVMLSFFRGLRTAGLIATETSSLACHSIHTFVFYASTIDLLLLFLLVVDRIISFVSPLTYRNMSRKQAILTCVWAYIGCFCFRFLPSYTNVLATRTVQCISSSFAVTAAYASYSKYLDFGLSVAILVAYIFLFVAIWYRFRRRDSDSMSNISDASLNRSMKIMPFLRLQLVMHCCLVLTSRTMQVAGDFLGAETVTAQRLQAYYGQLCSIDVMANAIIFYWRHPKLWNASIRMFRRGERVVRVVDLSSRNDITQIQPVKAVPDRKSPSTRSILSMAQVAPMPLGAVS